MKELINKRDIQKARRVNFIDYGKDVNDNLLFYKRAEIERKQEEEKWQA